MRVKRLALSAAVIVFAFAPSLAWDKTGHEAVALIASQRLDPAAQTAIADLLETPDAATGMKQYAAWADEIRRGRYSTAPWHYVDIPISSDGYDPARDCANDNCIVAQIKHEVAVLKDPALAKPVRAEALKFLIHFAGDIHQPLHCADNQDKGGNRIAIMVGASKTNLHAVWDNAVLGAIGKDSDSIAKLIGAKVPADVAAQWSTGTPEQWAGESFLIAKTKIYPAFPGSGATAIPIVLPDNYPASVGTITATQIAKAGFRLAALLNAAFATPAVIVPGAATATPPPVAAPATIPNTTTPPSDAHD